MKSVIKILVFSVYLLGYLNLSGQINLKNYELSIGYSIQKQDRRLFDFPNQDELISGEKSKYDYTLELLFNKNYFEKGRFNSGFTFGYLLNISKFSRPFDHNYFTHAMTKELRFIETYLIHNLRLANKFEYILLGDNNKHLSLVVPIGFDFAFNKFASTPFLVGKQASPAFRNENKSYG